MKYMGSKARFAKQLSEIVCRDRNDRVYVEPFVGGANMIAAIDGERIAYDSNESLIAMWNGLISGALLPRKVTREEYEEAKVSEDLSWRGWVGFNCSYSGKYFGGYAGETKTKSGSVRDYQDEAIRNIRRQIDSLREVKFFHSSYDAIKFDKESLIYCDPPYAGTTEYKDKFDHDRFWNWCNDRVSDGHKVFVSEYVAPSDWQCVWSKEVGSSLSANGRAGGRKQSVERLFAK